MILRCNYEELTALANGIESILASHGGGGVAAPPEAIAGVEALLPRLVGDLTVNTLEEQQQLQVTLDFVLEHLNVRMDEAILAGDVASEDAVLAYFDYGHVLSVCERMARLGEEMSAMIELMTGEEPTPGTAREITFPD